MAVPIANAGTSPASKAFTDLPTSQALSFSGTWGTGGSSITRYKSAIIDRPAGSAAALSSTTSATPTVNNVDQPGTVLVFLRVADNRFNNALAPDPWLHADNASYVSEANPLKAPDSAFVRVSVRTENLDIEIPASGQRYWKAKYKQLVDAAEAMKATADALAVADLDTTATGAELDTLTDGSDASALHTHATITTKATTSTHGIVRLASAPADAANPKAVTQHLLHYFCSITTVAAKLIADNEEVFTFRSPYGATLVSCHIVAPDGWNGDFDVFVRTEAQYLAGSFGTTLGVIPLTNSAARAKGLLSVSQSLNAGDYIIVTRKTPTSTPGSPTRLMVCSLALTVQY